MCNDIYDYDYLEYVLGSLVAYKQMSFQVADKIWADALNGIYPEITNYPWAV